MNSVLTAVKRDVIGHKVKHLRKLGLVPACVFGSKMESISLSLKLDDLKRVYKLNRKDSAFDLQIEGEKAPLVVKISHLQIAPTQKVVLHVDLQVQK